ncbi:ran guanine nucleotide release factor-like isoform X2 [Gigantopelta aegis]|nr:ran guanine nucleotide release factor-like isoform X2 [Gigantopelta aegis]
MDEGEGHTDLFGGALSAVIPKQAKDVSTIREIPDNQEIFAHNLTDQSIIVEILEYVDQDDEEAVKTHFDDLADSNDAVSADDSQIHVVEVIPADQLAMAQCEKAFYVRGQQKIAKFKEAAKNTVNIHLGLFRLPAFTTDILVTFNDPVNINPHSSSHKSVATSADLWMDTDFKQLLKSLKINDTAIFG